MRVVSKAGSKTKVADFLDSLSTKVLHIGAAPNTPQLAAEVASQCISFAAPKIKIYQSHLKPNVSSEDALHISPSHDKRLISPALISGLPNMTAGTKPA
ncbi:hypothetical protein PSPO01_16601 [Paraphaeosphaeria sporulosa]